MSPPLMWEDDFLHASLDLPVYWNYGNEKGMNAMGGGGDLQGGTP